MHPAVLVDFCKAFIKHVLSWLPDKTAPLYVGLTGGVRKCIGNKDFARVVNMLALAMKALKNRRLGEPTMRPEEEKSKGTNTLSQTTLQFPRAGDSQITQ